MGNKFKKRVRDRMAADGVSYSEALRRVREGSEVSRLPGSPPLWFGPDPVPPGYIRGTA